MSPEVLRGDGYDFKSDIWSLGCLLYELTMLKSPFKAEGLNLYSLFQKISQGDYQPLPETYSLELRTLAYKMISTKSEDRPEIADVCVRAAALRQLTAAGRKASAESVISLGLDDKNAKDAKDVKDKARAKVVEEKGGQSDSVSEDRTGRKGDISRMSSGAEKKEQTERHRDEEQDNRVESKIDNGRERESGRDAKAEGIQRGGGGERGGGERGAGGETGGEGRDRDPRVSGKASEKSNGSSSASGDTRNHVSRSRSDESDHPRIDLPPTTKLKGPGTGIGVGAGAGAGVAATSSRLRSPDVQGNSERERGKYLPPSNIITRNGSCENGIERTKGFDLQDNHTFVSTLSLWFVRAVLFVVVGFLSLFLNVSIVKNFL
jgi:serine/threonine protein kinase